MPRWYLYVAEKPLHGQGAWSTTW